MNESTSPSLTPTDIIRAFANNKRLWLYPTMIGALLGIVAALLMPRTWEASQTIIVRETATGGEQSRIGKFSSLSEMKKLQETLLELAKSKSVLAATLEEVGPTKKVAGWPSDRAIADFRKKISLSPPGGAEFGKTEIAYLSARAPKKERALKLVDSLCKHLESRFRSMREERASGMIDELKDAAKLAEENLRESTKALTTFESSVGADLSELRMLQASPSATSDLRQTLVAAENTKRQYETQQVQSKLLLKLLQKSQDDASKLLALPNSLLAGHPTLRRLKDGLVDAQLVKSRLLGLRSVNHPSAKAALETELQIQEDLFGEIASTISGLEIDIQVRNEQINAISSQIEQGRERMARIAEQRAEYGNYLALVKSRTAQFDAARKRLSAAKADRSSAQAASLFQRIDAPQTGVNPLGPGRTVVAGVGLIGGFFIGAGLLFLTLTPTRPMAPNNHFKAERQTTASEKPFTSDPSHASSPTVTDLPVESFDQVEKDSVAESLDYGKEKQAVQTEVIELEPEIVPATKETFGFQDGMTLRGALEKLSQQEQPHSD